MFSTALVALDLSPAEAPMLECLTDLQTWGVKRAVLTHVVKVGYMQGSTYGRREEYVDWLERKAAPLRERGLEVTVDVRASGLPAQELLAAAAEAGADLVVVGSRGQNMARQLFLGSTAREVIREAPLPVLLEWIEPSAEETAARCELVCHRSLARLVVATDFSRRAQPAEQAAIALVRLGLRVDVVHAVQAEVVAGTPAWPIMAKAALDDLAQRVAETGAETEVHLLDGDPAEAIAAFAEVRDASLIVVGKHGRGWMESMVIGSTAARICEIARRPVLMVPKAAGNDQA
jgi:nucleotide-binding universal stress UspA family protein